MSAAAEEPVEGVLVASVPFGWCLCGQHAPSPTTTGCPGQLPAQKWPDPARKGTYYWTPARACPCWCHQRPAAILSQSRTTNEE